MSNAVIRVLRGVAQTRDDENRMHEGDFSTPPNDGAEFWGAVEDVERLAALRAHPDYELLWNELSNIPHDLMAVQLLRELLGGP
jgi:hypothetical protein